VDSLSPASIQKLTRPRCSKEQGERRESAKQDVSQHCDTP
jgi:hypothetical protein